MSFNINRFKGNFKFGGLRPSEFEVQVANPIDTTGNLLIPFRVQAASVPESTNVMIEQSYFGRTIKVAGPKTYPDWTITVVEDEDLVIRNSLETWSAAINSPESNIRTTGSSQMSDYKSTVLITQFGQDGGTLRVYQMIGAFPSTVGAITLGWDQGNAIATYEVTFAYDYWIPATGGTTGNIGGIL